MHYLASTCMGLATLSMLAQPVVSTNYEYGQQRMFDDIESAAYPKGDDLLTEQIIDQLESGQFCGNTSTFELYSKGRPVTFLDGALWAKNNSEPAAFIFVKSNSNNHFIGHKNPFGQELWWQDNSGRQYINTDNAYEFAVRLAKRDSKEYFAISRGNRCLMFNDLGEAFMVSRNVCEPIEFRPAPAWNETWGDPTKWKNCAADQIEDEKSHASDSSNEFTAKKLRWTVCRSECSRRPEGSLCRRCNLLGHY